jgi:hypothetical protein
MWHNVWHSSRRGTSEDSVLLRRISATVDFVKAGPKAAGSAVRFELETTDRVPVEVLTIRVHVRELSVQEL